MSVSSQRYMYLIAPLMTEPHIFLALTTSLIWSIFNATVCGDTEKKIGFSFPQKLMYLFHSLSTRPFQSVTCILSTLSQKVVYIIAIPTSSHGRGIPSTWFLLVLRDSNANAFVSRPEKIMGTIMTLPRALRHSKNVSSMQVAWPIPYYAELSLVL